jgi:hypothetical protein
MVPWDRMAPAPQRRTRNRFAWEASGLPAGNAKVIGPGARI